MKAIKIFILMFFILLVSFGCAKKDDENDLTASDVEAPSAPSGMTAQETTGFINLSWVRSPETDVLKYRLYRSTSAISNSPAENLSSAQKSSFKEEGYVEETGTFYADADLVIGSAYYYRVSAVDRSNNESKKSNQVIITYGNRIAPAKPTGLTALPGSRKGEIILSWTANIENDLSGYNIYGADQGGGDFIFIASQSQLETSYTATGFVPGSGYFFRITALDNLNNQSEPSTDVFCKAKGDKTPPAMPAGLSALPGSSSGWIDLKWSANTEPDLAKYKIYQSATGTSYDSIDMIIGVIGQPPDTTYIVKGLDTTKTYFFRISAIDDSDNESNWSIRAESKVAP